MEIKAPIRVMWGTPCPACVRDACCLDLTQQSEAIVGSGAESNAIFESRGVNSCGHAEVSSAHVFSVTQVLYALETSPPAQSFPHWSRPRAPRAAVTSEGPHLCLEGDWWDPNCPLPGHARPVTQTTGPTIQEWCSTPCSPPHVAQPHSTLWKLFPPIDKARISRAAAKSLPRVPGRLCPLALWAPLVRGLWLVEWLGPHPHIRKAGASLTAGLRFP